MKNYILFKREETRIDVKLSIALSGNDHSSRPNLSHVATLEYPPIVEAKHIGDKGISLINSTMDGYFPSGLRFNFISCTVYRALSVV